MRKCPNCGSEVTDNAKFCLECGSSLKPVVPVCPNCGEEVPKGKFCPMCGTSVTTVKATVTKTETFEFEMSHKTSKGVFDEDYFSSSNKKNNNSFDDLLNDKLLEKKAKTEKVKKENILKEKFASFEYEEYLDGKYIIKKFTDSLELKVEIPSEVVMIADGAFEGTDVIEVKLNEGIKSIGKRAFAKCKYLKNINFPKSLNKIGDEAFYDCDQLNVSIPSSVLIVGDNVFNKKIETKQVEAKKVESKSKKVTNNNQNEERVIYYSVYLGHYNSYSEELFNLIRKYATWI